MDRSSPLARHQKNRLEQIAALKLCTDVSLEAFLESVGVDFDRTSIVKARKGERPAPLALLDLILCHVDDPVAVLNLWARDYDCTVQRREVQARKGALAEALDVVGSAAALAQAVQRGDPTDQLVRLAEAVEVQAREATAAVGAK